MSPAEVARLLGEPTHKGAAASATMRAVMSRLVEFESMLPLAFEAAASAPDEAPVDADDPLEGDHWLYGPYQDLQVGDRLIALSFTNARNSIVRSARASHEADMHIKLMLQTSHICDVEKPIPTPDQDDDDDPSPYAAAVLTDPEEKAARALLGQALPAPRGSDGRKSRYRVETAGCRVTVFAMRQLITTNWSHIQVILRSLAMGPVELVFELMRVGNLHMLLSFGQTCTVTISEEQKQRIAEHVPEVQVCSAPADLQRYLTEKVEAWQRIRPDWFQETWMELQDDADDARRTMQSDRAAGEREFNGLLAANADNPDKPRIYVVRGQAYEAIGEKNLAANDYRKAMELLHPEDLMIDGLRHALSRVT
jgi:hypothetical protein